MFVGRFAEQPRQLAAGNCPSCGKETPAEASICMSCTPKLASPIEPAFASSVAFPPSGDFVGRQREMGALQSALEETLAGRGRLVMLVGEPGIGKTRTAQELAAQAETLGVQVLWGRCYEEQGAPPYWPWVRPLRSYIQRTEPAQLRAEMGPGAADIAEIVSETKDKLPDLEPAPYLEPQQARFRLFDSITGFFRSAARSRPLVLVLDDLQWADEPTLLLLRFLAQQLAGSCILVVGCYRDVELSRQHPLSETLAWLSREQEFQIHLLEGLNHEETGLLIEAIGAVRPSQPLVENLLVHTEGNPYFLTEVVRLLSRQGTLEEAEIGEAQGFEIPESVRQVIRQRLNRLSERCCRVLTTASVIGREFSLDLLDRLIQDLSQDNLLEAVEEALKARLIEEIPQTVGQYQFAHMLTQETLSEELSLTRRARLHADIGEALEELYGTSAEAHAAQLAYHFTRAEAVTGSERLVKYSLLAGEQALGAYAYEEALAYFHRVLRFKEEQEVDAGTAAALFGAARAQVAIGFRLEVRPALDNLRQSFEYYAGVGEVERAVAVAALPLPSAMGVDVGNAGFISRALTLVPPDSNQAASLLSTYGLALYKESGNYQAAQDTFHRALSIAQREQDSALEMRTLARAAEVAWWHLRLREVVEYGRRAVELADQVDDLPSEIQARIQMGRALAALGESQEARLYSSTLLAAAERLRDRTSLRDALWRNAEDCFLIGEWEEARAYAARFDGIWGPTLPLVATMAMVEYETGEFVSGAAMMDRVSEQRGRSGAQIGEGFR
ncbi:MAG: AAA family ATPase [Dehalococcoidia bacterium]